MAVTATWSNHGKYHLAKGDINFNAHTFKIILMGPSFVFNKDTHSSYSDVSSSEIGTANGYTSGGQTLVGVAITQDDTNDYAKVTWSNPSWGASGGSIGPSTAAIIYDDTETGKVIIGCLSFNTSQEAVNGAIFLIISIEVRLT